MSLYVSFGELPKSFNEILYSFLEQSSFSVVGTRDEVLSIVTIKITVLISLYFLFQFYGFHLMHLEIIL